MNISSKIYIRKVHLKSLAENDCQLGVNIPVGKKPLPMDGENCIEFANLNGKWHNAYNSAPLSKEISVENPVVIYSKEFSITCYNYYQFAKATDFAFTYGYKNVQWAWLKHLMP